MKAPAPLQPLLGPAGLAALAALMDHAPLLAFDFDGTLAPIVPHPADARIAPAVATRLARLAARLPVAIVTGRALADVRPLLGFVPRYVVGNHGAEDEHVHDQTLHSRAALGGLRRKLARRAAELADAGVLLEDKGASIALHYRQAPDAARALALIERLLRPTTRALRVFGGKMVVNAMAADAPDKALAVLRLVQRSGAGAALFAGDDLNDEPVFAAAPPHWLTVRVGLPAAPQPPSLARFALDGPEDMAQMLDQLLALLGDAMA